MFIDSVLLSLYFETPLHTGATGALSCIDLPVQRERTTQWPVILASEVRAALRRALSDDAAGKLLGVAESDNDRQVSVGDGRLLLFPVRSSVAPFVWITCPAVLSRLRRDLERTIGSPIPSLPSLGSEEMLVSSNWSHGSDAFAIEDIVLSPKQGWDAGALLQLLPSAAAYESFGSEVDASVGVVSDEVFGFLVRTATEVSPAGSPNGGAVSYQELVPSDALFYVPIVAMAGSAKGQKKKESSLQGFEEQLGSHLQVGSGATLGRGWAKTAVIQAKGAKP
jgi:CRISPR-associated protein Cmr4